MLSGCDFLLTCSFEDNWPNVLVEAGAYGVIPIVGPGHGCEEFVKVFQFGFVADEYTAESFATTIEKLMDIRGLEGRQDFSERVRSTHDKRKVARQYAAVLNKLQFVT
ncbi:MAG: glycosyltransferase family 1 protein [Planctomycetota bacterium]|nr:MAG: glycosyltransferase family 1 protein [Planctomycetota bacterium]